MRSSFLSLLASLLFLCTIFFVSYPAYAFQVSSPADSTKKKTADSLRVHFISAIGSMRQKIDSTNVLHASRFVRTDARYISDLFWKIPGFFLRDLGEIGKPLQLTAFGSDEREVTVLLDGRPLNDPISGTLNPYDLPLESVDAIEPISGAEALPYTAGGSSSVLNIVTKQYNNTKPLTKLRYVQGPFNFALTDGLFTQNVARSTNVMLGFQRNVSDGRFVNSAYDSWQIRGRLRYNYSERFNLSLSDFYSTAQNGMNGGINPSGGSSSSDEVTAVVNSSDAYEKRSRHDLSLLGVGKFFADSTMTMSFHGYFSDLTSEYNDQNENASSADVSEHHHSSMLGASITEDIRARSFDAAFGVSVERLRVIESPAIKSRAENRSSLFGTAILRLSDFILPTVSVKQENTTNASALSFGVGVRVEIVPSIALLGDFSTSHRFPTFFERSWADSTVVRSQLPKTEQHNNIQVGLDFKPTTALSVSLSAFHNSISDAIVFQPGQKAPVTVSVSTVPNMTVQGLLGQLSAQLWKIELFTTWMYTDQQYGSQTKSLFPKWSASGELAYRNVIFSGAMDLRVGGRWHFASQHQGVRFVPRSSVFVENATNGPLSFSTADLFLVAQLGDAYINLSWENLFNVNYSLVPNYPMPRGGLRLGVNWTFID